MDQVTVPYTGALLVSHMAAYGFAVALDAAGIEVFVGHDPESQSFEPVVAFDCDRKAALAAIRASATQLEHVVEHDLEPGRTGNNRRATIWARASMDADPERLQRVLALRGELVREADGASDTIAIGLLAGLGSPACWGDEKLKTAYGATALDGVLGNHTSDFVRGVLRPTRVAAASLDHDPFAAPRRDPDKAGWAPSGTEVDYVHQWLAAVGLALLPVAHRRTERSLTPACWSTRDGGRPDRVTLPLLGARVSVSRLRALLGLAALRGELDVQARQAGTLRSHGVLEVVEFARRDRAGAGTSVAFEFGRGRRIALR
jgi:hypothetical protein